MLFYSCVSSAVPLPVILFSEGNSPAVNRIGSIYYLSTLYKILARLFEHNPAVLTWWREEFLSLTFLAQNPENIFFFLSFQKGCDAATLQRLHTLERLWTYTSHVSSELFMLDIHQEDVLIFFLNWSNLLETVRSFEAPASVFGKAAAIHKFWLKSNITGVCYVNFCFETGTLRKHGRVEVNISTRECFRFHLAPRGESCDSSTLQWNGRVWLVRWIVPL